ncbi:hypothetical protein P171DRAFT_450104 [Karstenula rhodostoma CBS 690.94]|uniref:Uncharacterized protein n=1 Tax=Karstenula rhodostoma CBS 690.94 TaxID=1392251 RepID=A0A9P4P662_9PLEO|nr:hypothetical protein P171DRAFT_450104 [Karstenula rhodostoma CBS 690.94]
MGVGRPLFAALFTSLSASGGRLTAHHSARFLCDEFQPRTQLCQSAGQPSSHAEHLTMSSYSVLSARMARSPSSALPQTTESGLAAGTCSCAIGGPAIGTGMSAPATPGAILEIEAGLPCGIPTTRLSAGQAESADSCPQTEEMPYVNPNEVGVMYGRHAIRFTSQATTSFGRFIEAEAKNQAAAKAKLPGTTGRLYQVVWLLWISGARKEPWLRDRLL